MKFFCAIEKAFSQRLYSFQGWLLLIIERGILEEMEIIGEAEGLA